MTKPNVVEKCIGSVIDWAPGTDPTKEKKKKKVTKGKTTKTITKTIKVESFFNFFETIQAQINQNGAQPAGGDDDDSEKEDPENALGEQMDHDFDMGNDIKDDLIPLALEYYLGVIEKEEDDSDEDEDSEEELAPSKSKKQSKKKDTAGGEDKPVKGPNGEECKQ